MMNKMRLKSVGKNTKKRNCFSNQVNRSWNYKLTAIPLFFFRSMNVMKTKIYSISRCCPWGLDAGA